MDELLKNTISTPISDEDICGLNAGDIIYLTGMAATCRDDGHKRVVEEGVKPDFDLAGMCIIHAGPIVKQKRDGSWEMVSIGPTTSRRMEAYEGEFIKETGVKIIIGKGGMGAKTAEECRGHKAIHCIYPGGCAVTAATQVEEIVGVEWEDLGMPEAFWLMKVKEFGPLIVSIDTKGNNLFEENKKIFEIKKNREIEKACLNFIKNGHT